MKEREREKGGEENAKRDVDLRKTSYSEKKRKRNGAGGVTHGGARARVTRTAREAILLRAREREREREEEKRERGAHSSFILIQHDLQQLAEAPHDGPSD